MGNSLLDKNDLLVLFDKKNKTHRKNTEGYLMWLIDVEDENNVKVIFEDGTIVEGVALKDFFAGEIKKPFRKKNKPSVSLNEFTLYYYFGRLGFKSNFKIDKYKLDLFHGEFLIDIEYDSQYHVRLEAHDNRRDTFLMEKFGITNIRIRTRNLPDTLNAVNFHVNSERYFCRSFERALKKLSNFLNEKYGLEIIDINFARDKEMIKKEYNEKYDFEHIGEEYFAVNGEKIVIINYVDFATVLVQYENDKYAFTTMTELRKGKKSPIRFGNLSNQMNRVGEIKKMNNGIKAVILRYKDCNHIDVLFENGMFQRNKRYCNFEAGKIALPK